MRTGISPLDLRLGLRMLVKHPALTLVGGLGIAVSIAVSVGFFAFIGAHFNPPLPLDEGERIVALENRDVTVDNEERRSLHDFVLWRETLRTVDDLGAFRTVTRDLVQGEGPPDPVRIAEITAGGLQVARVPPALGRSLTADDERPGAPPVVIVGHDVWQRRFAGDPAIVGREIRLGKAVHTVIGVMPEGFTFPMNHHYWTPFQADPARYERRAGPGIFVFGRLAPGVTMAEAQAELDVVGQRTAADHPESNASLQPMVMPYTHSLTDIQGMTTWMVVQMQLMMSLLLVVVAFNVAVLVYARTATRQGEIAVRTALGASRSRIIGQLFIEALLLSLGAAAVGLTLAHIGVGLGNQIMQSEVGQPFWADYSLRPATVVFTVGVAVLAAVIVGVLPAFQATGRRLQSNLRQLGGGTGMRLGKTWTVLIVAQVAIAVAGLPAAVNMGWGEIRTATTRPTYPPDEFLVANLRMDETATRSTGDADMPMAAPFGDRLTELLRQLAAEPQVAGVTYTTTVPGGGGRVEVDGLGIPAESPSGARATAVGVGPGYFEMYGARGVTGRGFESSDRRGDATAVIVNQAFVTQLLDDEHAVGRRVRYTEPALGSGPDSAAPVEARPWFEIVGVVENLQVNEMAPDLVRPVVFHPAAPVEAGDVDVEVRVQGTTPAAFAPRLREIVMSVDPTLQLGTTYSLAEFERQNELAVRLVALVIGLVLLSVFLLSAAGVYALTSFTVTRRRREIGIRTALGAHPGQVMRTIFAKVARQVGLGLVIGLAAAALIEQFSGGELLGGRAPILLPLFGIAMAVVALVAAIGPARRGLRIQPTEALRADA